MTPIEAACAAGWIYWCGVWLCTDLESILANECPPYFDGTARDLCLSQGIEFNDGSET